MEAQAPVRGQERSTHHLGVLLHDVFGAWTQKDVEVKNSWEEKLRVNEREYIFCTDQD